MVAHDADKIRILSINSLWYSLLVRLMLVVAKSARSVLRFVRISLAVLNGSRCVAGVMVGPMVGLVVGSAGVVDSVELVSESGKGTEDRVAISGWEVSMVVMRDPGIIERVNVCKSGVVDTFQVLLPLFL